MSLTHVLSPLYVAHTGNFGVIVKYYLDKEKMAMNAPPLTFHQVVVTIVPFDKIPHHDDANNGATLYNKIWQTYWNYYKSPDNDPTTFGFLRANKDGITLFASSGSHEGLYEYIRLFVTVLSDYDPSGTLLQYITVDHGRGAGYGDGGGSSQVIGVPVDATGTSGQPTGITGITGFTMDKLSAQFDRCVPLCVHCTCAGMRIFRVLPDSDVLTQKRTAVRMPSVAQLQLL